MHRKEQQRQRRLLRSLTALVLVAGAAHIGAAELPWGVEQEDPMWTVFVPHLRYLKLDAEAEQTSFGSKSAGGAQTDYQRIYLSSGLGIGWDYFLYHPDLFTFSLLAEPGYDWTQVNGSGYDSNQDSLLMNGYLNGILLREKPYATTVNYTRSHADANYNFYNTATTDTEILGVVTGWREGPVPVSVAVSKSNSDSVGYNQETVSDQLTIDLHARNERKKQNATDFTYQFSQLNYNNYFKTTTSASDNTYHNATLTDVEHFKRSSLRSSVAFYDISSSRSASENLNASVGFNLEHTPHLHSFYNYSFSDYSGNGADSIQNSGAAGLSHQLFESLGSSISVHGTTLNSSSFGSTLDSVTFGATESEDYTKRLGEWGRFSIGNNVNYDVTDQQTTGTEQFIADESYAVPHTGPMIIRLKLPREISISSVKKNNIELDPSEWQAIKTTDPWQIQFFNTPINNIQPDDAITVSYTVEANPSGSYSTFGNNCHVSLRFWHDRAEIYASYNFTINQADSPDFLLQDVQSFEAGADFEWHNVRLRGSYTDQRSTLYDYQSLNLSEGYSTPISLHSSIGVDLNQQWSIYPPGSGTSTNQTQTASFYNFMAHYNWHPVGVFNWSAEAGYQQQSGIGYDQDLFAARTYFNWSIGKLEMHLGYEHDNQEYVAETRERDFVFLRMRRNF